MSRSVKVPYVALSTRLTPSAYSNAVSLWCEKIGLDLLLSEKSDGSVYTKPFSSPSKNENCQK